MARKRKQHPAVGLYMARYEHSAPDPELAPDVRLDPEVALTDCIEVNGADEGDVIYIYQVVAVKVIRKPTLVEDFNPEQPE